MSEHESYRTRVNHKLVDVDSVLCLRGLEHPAGIPPKITPVKLVAQCLGVGLIFLIHRSPLVKVETNGVILQIILQD